MAKRKIVSLVLSLAIVVLMLQPLCCIGAFADSAPTVWDGSLAESYAGGDGTESNPYLISNASQLARLAGVEMAGSDASDGKYYQLTADIYLNDTTASNWTETARQWYTTTNQWLEYRFRGNFDGNGHIISGLYINNEEDGRSGGLFPALRGNVTIKNLGIVNSSVTLSGSSTNAGAFAGITDDNFTISNCFASSTVSVSASDNAAGIIGKICGNGKTFSVSDTYSNATLSATACFGIVAYQWPLYTGTISNVYTIGYDVFANDHSDSIEKENEYSNVKTQNYWAHDDLESTANMIGQNAKDNMDFDWDNVWNTTGSKYPYLCIFDVKYADGLYTGTPGAAWDGTIAECYDDGDGTEANPYLIATAPELARLVKTDLANTEDNFYKLTADIILSSTTDGIDWLTSSQYLEYAFKGTFDGNGHIISGLNIRSSEDNRVAGLFPSLSGTAVIKNLGIVNSSVIMTGSNTFAGAFAGATDANFTFDKCFVASSVYVSATNQVAGFVGKVDSGSAKTVNISNCYSLAWLDGTETATNRYGFFGYMYRNYTGTVQNVYTLYHDIFCNNASYSSVTSTNAYSNVCEHSGYVHSNLWHKEYMIGNDAKNTYMQALDFGTIWDIKDNSYPYLRVFGDTYAETLYMGKDGIWDGTKAEAYSGGTGAYNNPYLISNANQLAKLIDDDINSSTNVYYKLTNDIVLNDTSVDNWTSTARQWYTTSASLEYHFEGIFDGNGHTVSGLYINNSEDGRMGGLFRGFGSSATIKNLGIVDSSITFTGATSFAGALAGGTNGDVNISNCFVGEDVTVSAVHTAAGFIGKVDSDTDGKVININNAYSLATLAGTTDATNRYGLFGYLWRNYTGNVKNVYTINHDLFANDIGTSIKTENEYSSAKEHSWFTHECVWHNEYFVGFEALKYLNFDWDTWVARPGEYAKLRMFTNETSLLGDVNCDDAVNLIDLVVMKKYYASATSNLDTTNDIIRKTSSATNALTTIIKYLLNNRWENQVLTPENSSITGYEYVWGDEFNGTGIDYSIWSTSIPNIDGQTSHESSEYLKVNNGTLTLTAKRTQGDTVSYDTAPWINSNAGMNFKYGYLEMRAKLPFDIGAFPSLWLATISGAGKDAYESLVKGTETEYSGEVDIFEYFGSGDNTISTNMIKWYTGADHAENSYFGSKTLSSGTDEYHIFGFEWTESYMKMYIDGECYATYDITSNFDAAGHTTDMDAFNDPAYIRLGNIFQIAKDTNTSDLTTEYSIDYIRLYQKPNSGSFLANN